MPKIVRNRSRRRYDTLRSQGATGDLTYFSVLLGDIRAWSRQFWLEKFLKLTWNSIREHPYSRSARKVCARLKPGTCIGGATPWEPCWIQLWKGERFHCVFSVPTPLWGKGQIYIMKQKQGLGREKGTWLIQETNKLWRFDCKLKWFPGNEHLIGMENLNVPLTSFIPFY